MARLSDALINISTIEELDLTNIVLGTDNVAWGVCSRKGLTYKFRIDTLLDTLTKTSENHEKVLHHVVESLNAILEENARGGPPHTHVGGTLDLNGSIFDCGYCGKNSAS